MYYAWHITVPANTPATAPVRRILHLSAGWVDRIRVGFPAGCAGLVGVRIKRFEFQILPLTPEEWLRWDGIMLDAKVEYHIYAEPYELIAECYNEDDSYDHEVAIHVEVQEHNVLSVIDKMIPASLRKRKA